MSDQILYVINYEYCYYFYLLFTLVNRFYVTFKTCSACDPGTQWKQACIVSGKIKELKKSKINMISTTIIIINHIYYGSTLSWCNKEY